MSKVCKSCKMTKPEDEFYFLNRERTKRRLECKKCTSAVNSQRKKTKRYGRCVTCGAGTAKKEAVYCWECYIKAPRHNAVRPMYGPFHHSEVRFRKDRHGYMMAKVRNPDGSTRYLSQHRCVMEDILGRSLRSDESVHHKNGVRDDNRPENLELWSRWQPSGQRVSDKIAWAIQLLEEYNPDILRLGPDGKATDCNPVKTEFDSQGALPVRK